MTFFFLESDNNAYSRLLPSQPTPIPSMSNNMTVQFCLDICNNYGYPVAGVEFGRDCWCSSKDVTSSPAVCNTGCSGDGSA